MKLHLIYARARNGTIGKDKQMPWHCPKTWRTSSASRWASRSSWAAKPGIHSLHAFVHCPGA